MVTKSSHKITLLAQNSKVLLIGTLKDELTQIIDTYFTRKEYIEFNENTAEILNDNLYGQYDVIVFSLDRLTLKLFKDTINYFPKHAVVLAEACIYNSLSEYINSIFSLSILPISNDLFMDRIYNVLCIQETNRIIKSKEKVINKYKNDDVNNDISDFLDKYHGTIMFLNEDLNDNCDRLKDLEISDELFTDISSNILKLNNILQYNKSFHKLSITFTQLSNFLITLDLASIKPENYSAFDYLTTIVEDITIYLDELFVYKLFKDVHVFEDSLENNVNFFEDSLNNVVDEEDNLEFF